MRAALVALAIGLLVPTVANAAAPGEPSVDVPAAASVGDVVTIDLHGWPDGLAEVTVCGNSATRGSVDCDLGGAAIAQVGDGTGQVQLRLTAPPSACPCVVRAATMTSAIVVTAALDLAGVSAAPAPTGGAAAPRLLVTSAVLRHAGGSAAGLASALGLHADRLLEVTVRNVGTRTVVDAPWSIWLGRDSGSGRVIDPVPLGTIAPGEERTYEVPVVIDGPAFGSYVISARIDGIPQPAVFGAETRTWPWLSTAIVVFGGCWLLVRRRSRHRDRPAIAWMRAASLTAAAGGVLVLAYVGYTLWSTSAEAAGHQAELLAELEERWSAPVDTLPAAPDAWTGDVIIDSSPAASGDAFGRLSLPETAGGGPLAIVEGVRPDDLAMGPGHYPGTAAPGEVGNLVIAGHRTSYLSPFEDLDRLRDGDEVVLETDSGRFTYAVRRSYIVDPSATDVLLPVPGSPGVAATERLLTLITCHPKHSTAQRLIVEAVLVGQVERLPGSVPGSTGAG